MEKAEENIFGFLFWPVVYWFLDGFFRAGLTHAFWGQSQSFFFLSGQSACFLQVDLGVQHSLFAFSLFSVWAMAPVAVMPARAMHMKNNLFFICHSFLSYLANIVVYRSSTTQ